jgi:hypothetical protein
METNANSDKRGAFGHFLLLLGGFIVALIGISFLVIEFMK